MDELNQAQVAAQLAGLYSQVTVVESCPSTNAALLADPGAAHGTALITDDQTAGHGRMGRAWSAPRGTQLSLSVCYRPPTSCVDRLGLLPLAAGVAITDVLDGAQLKWPNDVYMRGRKVCGILAEAADLATNPRVILGLGINVTMTRAQLPVPTATSLLLEGVDTTVAALAVPVLRALAHRYAQWESGSAEFMSAYRRRSCTVGNTVRVERPTETIVGVATGIGPTGELEVTQGTRTRSFSAGDVTHLRPAGPA